MIGKWFECPARKFDADFDIATEKIVGIDATSYQIGVGNGWFTSTISVAGWSWNRASAQRSDFEGTAGVDPGNAAAAGPDLDDIDHRSFDWIASILLIAFDSVVGGDRDLALMNQRALGCSSTDIECDQIVKTRGATDLRGSDHASDGPGFDHMDWLPLGKTESLRTAIGFHHIKSRVDANFSQTRFEIPQIVSGRWSHIGVQHCSARAFVFAPLSRDFG